MEVHRGEKFFTQIFCRWWGRSRARAPALIVQNEIGNRHSPTVIAAGHYIPAGQSPPAHPHRNIRSGYRPARQSGAAGADPHGLDSTACGSGLQITPEDQKRVDQF